MPLPIFRKLGAACLLLAAGLAHAAPIGLGAAELKASGAFSQSFHLQLTQPSLVSLQLTGWSADKSDLRFGTVTLTNGDQTVVLDHSNLGAALLAEERRGSGRSIWTAYLQTFDLAPLSLDAGGWTVVVSGNDEHLKWYSGFELSAQSASVVSEPASLALVVASLLGGGLLMRRRKARVA